MKTPYVVHGSSPRGNRNTCRLHVAVSHGLSDGFSGMPLLQDTYDPKGPRSYIVHTQDSKGFPYSYFGVQVYIATWTLRVKVQSLSGDFV